MSDREIFYATLRMYEKADGQPKARLLDATTDVSALVEELFDGILC